MTVRRTPLAVFPAALGGDSFHRPNGWIRRTESMIDARNIVQRTRNRVTRSEPAAWLRRARRHVMRRSEGEALLKTSFADEYGYPLDVDNPRTFSEKAFSRMVRWNRRMDPKFCRLTDKLAVRPYVSRRIGDRHLVPLLWHGKDPRRIPFDRLPASYVVKTNHGSGYVIDVQTGVPDRGDIVRSVSTWLASNLYWVCREYQYYQIPPRVMVEEYLKNRRGAATLVYGFYCFDGVPYIVRVGDMRRSMNPYYDLAWNQLDIRPTRKRLAQPLLDRPERLDQMVDIAARLSQGFDFVRVDLYNVDGHVFFSELTFTPAAGRFHFDPHEWDLKLGERWAMRE